MENHERETEQARVDNVEKQIDQQVAATTKLLKMLIVKHEQLNVIIVKMHLLTVMKLMILPNLGQ